MRKFYGPPIPGSISPVPATEEMTEPVGIKDGQLWTKGPDGGLEDRVETLETDVGNLQETATEHGTAINNLETDMTDAENDISGLQNRMTAAESNIGTNAQEIGQLQFDVSQVQTDIVGLGLSKLDKPTNTGEVGDVIVKTATGTEYQAVAPFNPNGTYPNVTAGKAISAKSLENVSEDSGSTQTAPFFFQATATANNTTETPTAPVFELKSLRGNTIVYNQLVDGFSTTYDTISGHKYWAFHVGQPPVIVTSEGTPISFPSPQSDKLVDLTRWFNGSIPQAILDDPTIFPVNYYDGELTYSAGELKNCSCTELTIVGKNQLDSSVDYIPSTISTYSNALSPAQVSNWKSILESIQRVHKDICWTVEMDKPTAEGSLYMFSRGTIVARMFNGIRKNIDDLDIDGITDIIIYGTNPASTVNFSNPTLTLSWDGVYDGQTFPYVKHTYPMVWSGKSAGSAYDERLPDGTEITRIVSVDLSQYPSAIYYDSGFGCWVVSLESIGYALAKYSDEYSIPNIVDSIGTARTNYYGNKSNAMTVSPSGNLLVGNGSSEDKPTQTIYYELATPTTSEGTPYTSEIEGDDYGTMSFDSVVPVGNEFFYPADYALLIDDLGNYTGYDVTKLMLKTGNVVPSAPTSDGTYVLKCVVSGGTPSYSWIAET